jgi:hypothetical protein
MDTSMPSFRSLTLAERDKRALRLAAAFCTLLLTTRVLPAVLSWRRGEMERARLEIAGVSSAREQSKHASLLRDSLAARQARLAAMDSAFIRPEGANAPGAELVEFLTDAAERTEVLVSSIRIESVSDSEAKATLGRVRVRASLSGDLAGIATLIAMVERPPRLFTVRELSITQRDPSTPHNKDESLEAEVAIEGLTATASLLSMTRAMQ